MSFSSHQSFEEEILSLLESKKQGLHKTIGGKFVKMGTDACRKDILKRIDDIKFIRDQSSLRSDERSHYTGVLGVLRRRLRENDRIMASQVDKEESPVLVSESFSSEKRSVRILRLAGLL